MLTQMPMQAIVPLQLLPLRMREPHGRRLSLQERRQLELSELDDRNQRLLSKAAGGGGGDEDEDEDEGADISHMKLWRMKDLGVQTVHSILRSEVRACVC